MLFRSVLNEEELSPTSLKEKLLALTEQKDTIIEKMNQYQISNSIEDFYQLITQYER